MFRQWIIDLVRCTFQTPMLISKCRKVRYKFFTYMPNCTKLNIKRLHETKEATLIPFTEYV